MTRSRLVIVAVALLTLAILVRGHSDDDTPAPTALQTPTGSFHARTRAPALALPDASIAGTVRDDHGRGLAGAQICARNLDVAQSMMCTSSDAHGGYRVDAILPGQLDVWASARGRRPESYEPRLAVAAGDHRDKVDLVLHAGGVEIHGTISAVGRKPIAGARVEVGGLATRTDDAGHYSMWVRPSWAVIQVSADHYADAWHGGPAPGQLDLALSPGSRMTGIVVDDAGVPVAGATVTAGHADFVRDGTDWNTQPAVSDERGHFAIAGLEGGRYEISARASHGYGIAAATPVTPGTNVDGVVVRLARGFEVVGRVTKPGGATCLDSVVWLEDSRGRSISSTRDGDGTLHVGGLAAGEYAVYPSCADHRRSTKRTRIVIADRDVEQTWSVESGATVRGRIVTSRGRSVAGVDVGLTGDPVDPREREVHGYVESATDGTYAIHGLPAGRYQVSTTGWTSSAAPIQMKATLDVGTDETTTHDFEVDEGRAGASAGHVVDREGHVPHVTIGLRNDHLEQSIQATVDDAGSFVADGIPVGTYRVTVDGDEGELPIVGAPTMVQIRSGETAWLNLVVTPAGGSIRGRVVDDLGEPAAGVTVTATTEGGDPTLHFESSLLATTDADGRFVVAHLSGATYKVRAFRREGVDTTAREVALGSDITLHLPGAGSLSGAAHASRGRLGDLDVQIFDARDTAPIRAQTFPNSDGHFDIADLPVGNYLVSVTADGAQGQANVTITSGERAMIDIALPGRVTIVGRVVDARTGRPVPDVALSANRVDSSASSVTTADDDRRTTDADGRFTVVGVPRGPIVVTGQAVHGTIGWVDVQRDTTLDGDVIDVGVLPVVTHAFNNAGDCNCLVAVRTEQHAAVVVAVTADGAAERAGLVEGDVVTAVDGIDTTAERAGLASLLLGGDAGTSVEVTVRRGDTLVLVRSP